MEQDLRAVAADLGASVRPPGDDADGLVRLIGDVFAEYPGCVLDPEGLDADLFAWRDHLAAAGGRGWVVERAGRVVACVGVAPCDPPPAVHDGTACVELKRLYVDASVRQRGLGGALVRRVEAWAREHGADAVVLWSDTRFADAHRLYTAAGYTDTGRRRDLHDPSDTTEAEFVRRL